MNYLKIYKHICYAKSLYEIFEEKKEIIYNNSSSRGHEKIQLAVSNYLKNKDYLYPYYRDDAMILGLGIEPKYLINQWLSKKDDIFSGGKHYYAHFNLNLKDKPKIPHQSSSTGMQAVAAVGAAIGLRYKNSDSIVVCSLGDGASTEGDFFESLQMASLKNVPIIFLIQDNGWSISAKKEEILKQNFNYSKIFKNIKYKFLEKESFEETFICIKNIFNYVRNKKKPYIIHSKINLIANHTSKINSNLFKNKKYSNVIDPFEQLKKEIINKKICSIDKLEKLYIKYKKQCINYFEKFIKNEDPGLEELYQNIYAKQLPIPSKFHFDQNKNFKKSFMVECGVNGISELMKDNIDCILYGQDVGDRIGGVFKECNGLQKKFGLKRVFNTPIQESFIVGSICGMSAVGLFPIVEVPFGDYFMASMNQLYSEISKSNYLTNGNWPVRGIIRVPVGIYGCGGPYHSATIESILTNINGIKIVYPSNGKDFKGLIKAAYYDNNPIIFLEHKGLYWGKVPYVKIERDFEPDECYFKRIGEANILKEGKEITIISYGLGVHLCLKSLNILNNINAELIDLVTLKPIDWKTLIDSINKTKKCIIVTEDCENNNFCQALSGKLQRIMFDILKSPIVVIGSKDTPAVPVNRNLESFYITQLDTINYYIKKLCS